MPDITVNDSPHLSKVSRPKHLLRAKLALSAHVGTSDAKTWVPQESWARGWESQFLHSFSVPSVLERDSSLTDPPGVSSQVKYITFNCPCRDGLRIQNVREPHFERVPLKRLVWVPKQVAHCLQGIRHSRWVCSRCLINVLWICGLIHCPTFIYVFSTLPNRSLEVISYMWNTQTHNQPRHRNTLRLVWIIYRTRLDYLLDPFKRTWEPGTHTAESLRFRGLTIQPK